MPDFIPEVLSLADIQDQQSEHIQTDALDEQEERPVAHSSAPITLKCGDAFLVADAGGDFLASRQEVGLFWHGTRFLRTCNLFLEGRPLITLSHHVANMGNACQVDLTNAPLSIGDATVGQGDIHVHRHLELKHDYLLQTLTITNFHTISVPVTLGVKIGADFCDLFEVRGANRIARGESLPEKLDGTSIVLGYRGLDMIERETCLTFDPPPAYLLRDRGYWKLQLVRGQAIELRIRVAMREVRANQSVIETRHIPWNELSQPVIQTDDALFNRLLKRGMHDLMMLNTMTEHGHYPYAGIPWFCCPFGRDALITCLQFLPWFPEVIRGTLAFLAAHQGTKIEEFTDEEPGKILHEYRTGEMANCREIPFIPYYGTIDATPLFLVVLAEYIRWTDDLPFLKRLWKHAEAAVAWMMEYGDRDGDGFLEYHKASEKGLANQGWKDAWDSISYGDGRLAISPIALCEVQGYAYAAYRAMGYLASRLGKPDVAHHWDEVATMLREKFLRHFWWEEEQTIYLALDAAKAPCDVVTSNAGQCIWSGIVPEEKARKIIDRLMRADMHSGWGIRTLSTTAGRYNPMSYHNGSVWPHDTALVGAGFAQYGGKSEAGVLLKDMYEASLYFEGGRLPELYCGFEQRPGYGPTRYPVACSPQAWASGAPMLLVNALLGFQPDAAQRRLILRQPTLPLWLRTMEIRGLFLGQQHLHLQLIRAGESTSVVIGSENEVEVQINA